MTDYAVARRRMVREQLEEAGLGDRRVLGAMREVPRHLFVPRILRHRAHQPSALPIGYGQTISKPFTVGLMSELLELAGHEHVLEIGTGSGYQAAVLGWLARSVVTVERIGPLAERARGTLAETGTGNVLVLPEDGSEGWHDGAPYDAIIVTACAPHLPPLLLGQLRDGGRLLIPVDKGREQILYRYRRRGQEVEVEQSLSCRFVPLLRGLAAPDDSALAGEPEAAAEGDQLA
ncbi:MAG: protein-L-isoaspartate(D-aspartate) O-methyltransferase [Krumholzibacteria bacterium]|nr:protein-L-isoaspartate(D-aspartate) O-methyltransferase [Candidatus Krumholzibacteria bacterium]